MQPFEKATAIVRTLWDQTRKWAAIGVAALEVSLIVLISPLYRVRLQGLNESRIGHEAMNTELTLLKLRYGLIKKPVCGIDLWIGSRVMSSNKALFDMRARTIKLAKFPGRYRTLNILHKLKLTSHLIDSVNYGNDRDLGDLLIRSDSLLGFTEAERQEANAQIKNLTGYVPDKWVCLHQRDSAYLTFKFSNRDWSYHDYRDSSISNYVLAAEALADLGYAVFRMGAMVKDPIPTLHSAVFDYAMSPLRSELLDCYLSAHCDFFVATGSGLDAIPRMFHKPRVFVNLAPYGVVMIEENSINIFKHYAYASSGKKLTQGEIIRLGLNRATDSKSYANCGVYLTENTAEEIRDAVLEMHLVLSSQYHERESNKEKQTQFWQLFERIPEWHGTLPIRARIGSDFLAANPQWLS